jgi:hypothetical protein
MRNACPARMVQAQTSSAKKLCSDEETTFVTTRIPKILLIENDPVAGKEIRATLAARQALMFWMEYGALSSLDKSPMLFRTGARRTRNIGGVATICRSLASSGRLDKSVTSIS